MDNMNGTVTGETSENEVIVPGLAPYMRYEFKVSAMTKTGFGPYSNVVIGETLAGGRWFFPGGGTQVERGIGDVPRNRVPFSVAKPESRLYQFDLIYIIVANFENNVVVYVSRILTTQLTEAKRPTVHLLPHTSTTSSHSSLQTCNQVSIINSLFYCY